MKIQNKQIFFILLFQLFSLQVTSKHMPNENQILQERTNFDNFKELFSSTQMVKDTIYTIQTTSSSKSFEGNYTISSNGNDILNIYCISGGEADVTLTIKNSNKSSYLEVNSDVIYNGKITILNETEHQGETLEINCNVNFYPTFLKVSIRTLNTEITPEDNAIYGYLDTSMVGKSTECFNISNLLTGSDYIMEILTKEGNVYAYTTNSTNEGEITSISLNYRKQESFRISKTEEIEMFCVKPIDTSLQMGYTIQLLHLTNYVDGSSQSKAEPQVNGLIYNYILQPGQTRYFRRFKHNKDSIDKTSLNVREEKGFVNTYLVDCQNTECYYTSEQLENSANENIFKIMDVNGFHSINVNSENDNTIYAEEQQLLYVACKGDQECNFTVFFFDIKDYMELKENYQVVQVIKKGENDTYSIEIFDETVYEIEITFTLFSGDSTLYVEKETGDTLNKTAQETWNRVGNAEVVNIKYTDSKHELTGIYKLTVAANSGSFYSISYSLILKENKDEEPIYIRNIGYTFTEYVKYNENHNSSKLYLLYNRYVSLSSKFLITIVPINCILEVTYGDTIETAETIEQKKFYYQNLDTTGKTLNYYRVKCRNYNHNNPYSGEVCQFYLSAVTLTNETELVVSEGKTYDILMGTNTSFIRFLYAKPPDANYVFTNTKVEVPASLNMDIHVMNTEYNEKKYEFTRDRSIVLYKDKLDSVCGDLELCIIKFHIEMVYSLQLETGTYVVFNVRTNKNIPVLLEKQTQIEDIVHDSGISYFMFEVMEGEQGDIVVNFNRGSGKLIGKIVRKDKTEIGGDWKNRVRLPKKTDESSTEYKDELIKGYDGFKKTLKYTSSDTSDCSTGCELYLGVISTEEYYSNEYFELNTTLYFLNDFNIYVKSYFNESELNSVLVPTGDYVYGTLDTYYNIEGSEYYQNKYTMVIMNDGDELVVDLQATYLEMKIEYGNSFQIIKCTGEDKYVRLKTSEFSTKSLVGEEIIITITATRLDQIYYAPYAFRVYIPIDYSDDKYENPEIIDSPFGQRVSCEITSIETPCYFLIPKYDTDYVSNLMVYAFSDNSYDIEIYMKKTSMTGLDMFDTESLHNSLPNRNQYDSKSSKTLNGAVLSVLLTDSNYDDLFMFFAVYSSNTGVISFINTFRNYISKTSINTHTWQLFSVGIKDEVYQYFNSANLTLEIPTTYNSLLHIVNVNGQGQFIYDSTVIPLSYSGDSMSATIHKKTDGSNVNIIMNSKYLTELGFYIYITVRGEYENFDNLEIGTSTNFIYTSEDFPVSFYTQITENKKSQDYLLNFQINDLIYTEDVEDQTNDDFILRGTVTKPIEIINKITNSSYELTNLGIQGFYSKITRSGRIIIDKTSIQSVDSTTPNLVVNISKSDSNPNNYTLINLQIQYISLHNYTTPVPINQYYDSLLVEGSYNNIHKLSKTNENEKYMKIEFALNSDKINWAVLNDLTNFEDTKTSFENETTFTTISSDFGKTSIVLTLSDTQTEFYLVVFSVDGAVTNTNLTSYTFKYQTSSLSSDFITYIEGSKNTIVISKYDPIYIRIDTILFSNGTVAPGKYYISHLDPDEADEKGVIRHTIAPNDLDIKGLSIVTVTNKESIEVKLQNFKSSSKNFVYIMAIMDATNERLAYDIFVPADYKEETKIGIIVLAIIVLVVVVAILIIFLVAKRYSSKSSGSLKEKIEATSFSNKNDKQEEFGADEGIN